MSFVIGRPSNAALERLTYMMLVPDFTRVRTERNPHRARYSGSPVRNVSAPLILAFEFAGSSGGKSSREIMTIEQYAPLPLSTMCSEGGSLTVST